jgi:putative selenate reductase molybdopterin-binding subunit
MLRIQVTINQVSTEWAILPSETLLDVLRREGFFGAKSGGCEQGECGACTVLLDGRPVNSCALFAAQADGHAIQTIESLGEHPEKGWKASAGLHPIQQALVDSGAIQCGYCTPAMALEAKALLERNPDPTEAEVREALSSVLCRCTGYLKPVQAILQAAAVLRGEAGGSAPQTGSLPVPPDWFGKP